MIYEEKIKAIPEDCGRDGFLSEQGILRILEMIGSYHSDLVRDGLLDANETKIAWVLLDWRVEILKRPRYGGIITARTWARDKLTPLTTLRDYELVDESGECCVKASSRWTLFDLISKRAVRITPMLMERYEPESRHVFEDGDIARMREAPSFESETSFSIRRREIDYNGHVHNLCYLDYAMEVLPEDVYRTSDFRRFRINFRHEITPGEQITCRYHSEDGKHMIGIYAEDNTLHAIVELS